MYLKGGAWYKSSKTGVALEFNPGAHQRVFQPTAQDATISCIKTLLKPGKMFSNKRQVSFFTVVFLKHNYVRKPL